MIYLTRRYRFSAAHRLHNDALSAEENRRLYGKCDNPFGHGHNYVLDVTVAGEVDPATGMVFDLAALDSTVGKEILERFDLTNLNQDSEEFRSHIPTTENVCVAIYDLLRPKLKGSGRWASARLERVRLEETSSNFFEYGGRAAGEISNRSAS
ncbi:MAG: 6-carboxytetrahydropterin synthase [Deltaproteobacteria bacterium]